MSSLRRRAYYRWFSADALVSRVGAGLRVLDAGCSDGRGSEALTGSFGCDIYRPALVRASATGRRRHVVQTHLARLPYRSAVFDVVTALDVVEHFEKPEALEVLRELERVSRGLVVVLTPSGFLPQPPTEDEPWQEHRCGFEPEELCALGYEVRGVGGLRAARGPYGSFRGGPFGALAALGSQPYVRIRPERAFHLLATKRVAS